MGATYRLTWGAALALLPHATSDAPGLTSQQVADALGAPYNDASQLMRVMTRAGAVVAYQVAYGKRGKQPLTFKRTPHHGDKSE